MQQGRQAFGLMMALPLMIDRNTEQPMEAIVMLDGATYMPQEQEQMCTQQMHRMLHELWRAQ